MHSSWSDIHDAGGMRSQPRVAFRGHTFSRRSNMNKTVLAFAFAGSVFSASAMAQADNSNSVIDPASPSYHTWMHDSSMKNHGYISRQEYMDEMGRRWDRMDRDHRGLTTAQIDSLYAEPSHTRVKKGNSQTNPAGTELKGESGG
jgi:hypothetical protein